MACHHYRAFDFQSLEHLRLELGVTGSLLQLDYYTFEPIIQTTSWIQFVWKFLTDYGISLEITSKVAPLRQVNDVYIMDEVLKHDFNAADLSHFNQCRLYLKALTLADLTTSDGSQLTQSIMSGTHNGRTHQNLLWPEWGRPKASSWTVWRRILQLVFTNKVSLYLVQPLAAWINFDYTIWEWFVSPDQQILYQRSGLQWKQFLRIQSPTRSNKFHTQGRIICQPSPEHIQPTTVSHCRNFILVDNAYHVINIPSTPQLSLQEKLHPTCCQWLFHGLHQSESLVPLINSLHWNIAVAGSDGIFCPKTYTTTAGWTIKSAPGQLWLSGIVCPAFNSLCNGAYCGELAGLLAIVHMVTYLCLCHNVPSTTLVLSCDNIRAIEPSFQWSHHSWSPKHKHSDILSALAGLLQLVIVKVLPSHVYGHQDKNTPYEQLDRHAQINV